MRYFESKNYKYLIIHFSLIIFIIAALFLFKPLVNKIDGSEKYNTWILFRGFHKLKWRNQFQQCQSALDQKKCYYKLLINLPADQQRNLLASVKEETYLALIKIYQQENNDAQVIDYYRELTDFVPNNYYYHFLYGLAAKEADKMNLAKEQFEISLGQNPYNLKAAEELIKIHYDKQDYQAALDVSDFFVKMNALMIKLETELYLGNENQNFNSDIKIVVNDLVKDSQYQTIEFVFSKELKDELDNHIDKLRFGFKPEVICFEINTIRFVTFDEQEIYLENFIIDDQNTDLESLGQNQFCLKEVGAYLTIEDLAIDLTNIKSLVVDTRCFPVYFSKEIVDIIDEIKNYED